MATTTRNYGARFNGTASDARETPGNFIILAALAITSFLFSYTMLFSVFRRPSYLIDERLKRTLFKDFPKFSFGLMLFFHALFLFGFSTAFVIAGVPSWGNLVVGVDNNFVPSDPLAPFHGQFIWPQDSLLWVIFFAGWVSSLVDFAQAIQLYRVRFRFDRFTVKPGGFPVDGDNWARAQFVVKNLACFGIVFYEGVVAWTSSTGIETNVGDLNRAFTLAAAMVICASHLGYLFRPMMDESFWGGPKSIIDNYSRLAFRPLGLRGEGVVGHFHAVHSPWRYTLAVSALQLPVGWLFFRDYANGWVFGLLFGLMPLVFTFLSGNWDFYMSYFLTLGWLSVIWTYTVGFSGKRELSALMLQTASTDMASYAADREFGWVLAATLAFLFGAWKMLAFDYVGDGMTMNEDEYAQVRNLERGKGTSEYYKRDSEKGEDEGGARVLPVALPP